MAVGGALLLLRGLWGIRPAVQTALREIHCLRGTPRRWGCLAKTTRSKLIRSRWVLLIRSTHLTGNLTSPKTLASKRISIFISIATLSARGVFILCTMKLKISRRNIGCATPSSLAARCWYC
ncbi:IgaA/UmoB family intracellular growth attenuator [Shigella flexneri]